MPYVFRCLICIIALLVVARYSFASETVYFRGFAYAGNFSDIEANFPFTHAINELNGDQPLLDSVVMSRVKKESFPNFNLVAEGGFALRDSPIALVFALSREGASVERIAGNFKLLVELSAQALFFNFDRENPAVVGAYPFTVQYIHALDHLPTEAEIEQVVRALYIGRLDVNVFDEFVAALKRANPKRSQAATLRITEVQIEDKARLHLPGPYARNETNLQTFLADAFASYLSQNQSIPVLPYAKGYAVNNRMALAAADGEVFNLRIPEPDYAIKLTLRGFKKVLFDKRAAGEAWVYGAFIHVRLEEPEFGRVYLDSDFKQGATKKVPSGQKNVQDWPAFQEALLKLFDEFTTVLSNPSRGWTKKHGSKDAFQGLKKFREVVRKCA